MKAQFNSFSIGFQYSPETLKPWFVIETTVTSDGPRSRICNGFYAERNEAKFEAELRNREVNKGRGEENTKPKPVAFALTEGSEWQPWIKSVNARAVHAIRFEDGSEFDTVNGWRDK